MTLSSSVEQDQVVLWICVLDFLSNTRERDSNLFLFVLSVLKCVRGTTCFPMHYFLERPNSSLRNAAVMCFTFHTCNVVCVSAGCIILTG